MALDPLHRPHQPQQHLRQQQQRRRRRDDDEARSCRCQCRGPANTTTTTTTTTVPVRRKQQQQRPTTTARFHNRNGRSTSSSSIPTGNRHHRRRLRHPAAAALSSNLPSFIFPLLLFLQQPHQLVFRFFHPAKTMPMMMMTMMAHGYVITWNNGPEDKFFCGTSFDDTTTDCTLRQNCRSGRDDECDGYADNLGIKCFAETPCDSKNGGGSAFVPHSTAGFLGSVPTGGPTAASAASSSTADSNYEHTSDDPSDHWFCGIGFDDAEERCEVHCPYQTGCPVGEICYFGTSCDATSDAPTTRPTRSPTMRPTVKVVTRPGPTVKPVSVRARMSE